MGWSLGHRTDVKMGRIDGVGIRSSGKEPIPVILAKGELPQIVLALPDTDSPARAIAYVGTR
jgi:hypothetical protein